MAEYSAGQRLTAAALNARGVKVWSRRDTLSSTTTTTVLAVRRIDDIPAFAGRHYEIRCGLNAASTVATDNMRCEIRYTTDGSTPTTSSPVLYDGQLYCISGRWTIFTVYVPAVDETLSFLICIVRDTGSGNVRYFADSSRAAINLVMDTMDVSPGNVGTNL